MADVLSRNTRTTDSPIVAKSAEFLFPLVPRSAACALLTHSNHLWSDRKQIEKMQPYPPLQTMLAAGVLRENGITAALYDPTLETPAWFNR